MIRDCRSFSYSNTAIAALIVKNVLLITSKRCEVNYIKRSKDNSESCDKVPPPSGISGASLQTQPVVDRRSQRGSDQAKVRKCMVFASRGPTVIIGNYRIFSLRFRKFQFSNLVEDQHFLLN